MTHIENNRIAGTRITVWDVLHYLEHGCTPAEICHWLRITEEQVAAAAEYIDANREYVMQVHREIEERNVRGNSPETEEKLQRTQTRMQEWLREHERVPQ